MHSKKITSEEKTDKIKENITEKCTAKIIPIIGIKRRASLDHDNTEVKISIFKSAKLKIDTSVCFKCKRKLKIYNSYECSCGNYFCAVHRFGDKHDCNYDFKINGRKILEENNPRVRPKKI